MVARGLAARHGLRHEELPVRFDLIDAAWCLLSDCSIDKAVAAQAQQVPDDDQTIRERVSLTVPVHIRV